MTALDWLFDRINIDRKIQIEYVESTNQLADILTKGNFTSDEGNHLLHLFNIMSNTTFKCSHFFVPSGNRALPCQRGHKKVSRPITRLRTKGAKVHVASLMDIFVI